MAGPTATTRPPPWRDVRILRLAFQLGAVVAVGAFLAYLYDNLTANQRALGIETSLDFLDQQAGFRIAYSDFSPTGTVLEAMLVGLRNTITVALLGIVLTLILGTLVGIARLSSTWLVRRAAGTYVEAVRNVPPLLVIVFVNSALLATLPPIDDPERVAGLLLTVREIGVTVPVNGGGLWIYVGLLGAALAGAVALARWRASVEERTGRPARPWLGGGGLVATVAVGAWFVLDAPVVLSRPEVVNRSIEGGVALGLPFVAVLVGLVLYTATHVAEIVRGSILAVPKGQSEAATAVGLSGTQRLRYVVLPQAFRIAVPPTINQFLNLTKNTSLGVAVAYGEAMYVTRTVIGNGNPAIQSILVVMAMYLVVSLVISLVANLANRRLRLVER